MRYAVIGLEMGANANRHFQGYVEFLEQNFELLPRTNCYRVLGVSVVVVRLRTPICTVKRVNSLMPNGENMNGWVRL